MSRKNKHKNRFDTQQKIVTPKSSIPEEDDDTTTNVVAAPKPVCPRCGGDGFWHSTKTGYRAKTSSEPLIDKSRKCPECKG